MTKVLCNGFDLTLAETPISQVGGTAAVTGRSGRGLAYRKSANGATRLTILPTALSTLYTGFGMRWNGGLTVQQNIFFVAPDGSTRHGGFGVDATGHITIYGPAGTVVATSTAAAVVIGVWNYYEVKYIVHDTTGVIEVRQDEAVLLTYNGDTRNGAATTIAFIDSGNGAAVNSIDHDDHWVDDAGYLGDKTVETLDPTSNGSNSDWVGSDGNSTDNYLLVDDPTTPNMTDYVGASVSGKIDLYGFSDLPAGYSVDAIQEAIYVQKSDAGTPPTVLPFAKGQSGGTRADTALSALSTTATIQLGDLRTTDPDGNALTKARVDAMEVGYKIS